MSVFQCYMNDETYFTCYFIFIMENFVLGNPAFYEDTGTTGTGSFCCCKKDQSPNSSWSVICESLFWGLGMMYM